MQERWRHIPHHKHAWLLAALLAAAVVAFPAAAKQPASQNSSVKKATGAHHLTALQIDPYGKKDPLDEFNAWRAQNRVSLPVTPPVWNAHVQWMRYQKKLAAARKTGAAVSSLPGTESATVGTNVAAAGGVSGYQGEVTIAVNPNNPQELVAGANTFYQDPAQACQSPSGTTAGTQALYGSTDGGASWTYNCAPWPSNDTGGSGTFFGSDPTVAWDTNGNAYAVYMLVSQSGSSNGSSIVISKSSNAGSSWSGLGVIVNNLNNTSNFDDKEMMAIDTTSGQTHSHTNRIYVIWDENNTERVAYSDNGTSWTTRVVESSGSSGSDIGGDLAVGPDGTVYAIWNRLPSSGDTHVFAKSTDGGQTWSSPIQIASGSLSSFGSNNKPPAQNSRGVNAFGAIAVDRDASSPYLGNIYVVYPDFPSGTSSGSNLNIYMVKSTDGGSSWSSPVKLNDDSGTATQFFPWVTVDQSTGTVAASWYDTRNDSSNRKTQVFMTYSTNGGSSWASNVQVTQASSQFANSTTNYMDENTSDNSGANANQYGDYAQIAAANGKAWAIWTDTRQFYPSNSSNSKAEDVATAQVTISSSTTTYSISGQITSSGSGLSGVTVSTTGASATTDSSGNYTMSGLSNGTYTVTPSLSGYTFTPSSQSVTINGGNQTGINFTAAASTDTTPPAVSISSGPSGTITTNSASFSWSGSDNVTPASSLVYRYYLQGKDSGYGAYSSSTSASYSSLANGNYTFYVEAKDQAGNVSTAATRSFTVNVSTGPTQLQSGVPVNDSITSSTQNGAWNYYTINVPSGATKLEVQLTNLAGGSGGSDSGDADLYDRSGSQPTLNTYDGRSWNSGTTAEDIVNSSPAAGTWYVGVTNYDTGTITYTVKATVTTPSATYTISGTVTSNGSGLSGVSISTSGASATTDSSGNYTLSGLANGTYTVTPSLSGYTFTPSSQSVSVNGANQTGINFTATASGGGDTPLTSGSPVNGTVSSSSVNGAWNYYYIDVPSGATKLEVKLTNLTADADLYDRQGSHPTTSTFDGRSWNSGTTSEDIVQNNPASGRWYIGVTNYATGTINYTVEAIVTGSGGGDTTPPTVSITSPANGSTQTSSSVAVSWSGSDNVTPASSLVYRYQLDGGTWSGYASSTSHTFSGLADGSHTVGVEAKDQAGNVSSAASVGFTVSTGGGGSPTERMVNGGFESGPGSGWTESSTGGYELITTSKPHAGSYSAYLGGYNNGTDTISQSVTIPSNATTATLSYYWYMDTQDVTSAVYDKMQVYVKDGSGTTTNVASVTNMSSANAWYQTTFDLSAFKGQTVTLYFKATCDSSYPTDFFVDDVSVMADGTALMNLNSVGPSSKPLGMVSEMAQRQDKPYPAVKDTQRVFRKLRGHGRFHRKRQHHSHPHRQRPWLQ